MPIDPNIPDIPNEKSFAKLNTALQSFNRGLDESNKKLKYSKLNIDDSLSSISSLTKVFSSSTSAIIAQLQSGSKFSKTQIKSLELDYYGITSEIKKYNKELIDTNSYLIELYKRQADAIKKRDEELTKGNSLMALEHHKKSMDVSNEIENEKTIKSTLTNKINNLGIEEKILETVIKYSSEIEKISSFVKNLTSPLGIMMEIITAITAVVSLTITRVLNLSQVTQDLAFENGLVLENMDGWSDAISDASIKYRIFGVDIEEAKKSSSAIMENFGGSEKQLSGMIPFVSLLHTKLGISEEDSAKMLSNITSTTHMSIEQTENMVSQYAALQKNTKGSVLFGKVIKDIASMSASTTFAFRGNAKELMDATVQARAYGNNINDVVESSKSLLNFQNDIDNMAESQVLTGKQANTLLYAKLALQGKFGDLQRSQKKDLENDYNDIQNYNTLQTESYFKARGLTEEQGSNMLRVIKLQKEYGINVDEIIDKNKKDQTGQFNYQAAMNKQLEDSINNMKGISDAEKKSRIQKAESELEQSGALENIAGLNDAQSLQTKFQNQIASVLDRIAKVLEGPVTNILNLMLGALNLIIVPINAMLDTLISISKYFFGQKAGHYEQRKMGKGIGTVWISDEPDVAKKDIDTDPIGHYIKGKGRGGVQFVPDDVTSPKNLNSGDITSQKNPINNTIPTDISDKISNSTQSNTKLTPEYIEYKKAYDKQYNDFIGKNNIEKSVNDINDVISKTLSQIQKNSNNISKTQTDLLNNNKPLAGINDDNSFNKQLIELKSIINKSHSNEITTGHYIPGLSNPNDVPVGTPPGEEYIVPQSITPPDNKLKNNVSDTDKLNKQNINDVNIDNLISSINNLVKNLDNNPTIVKVHLDGKLITTAVADHTANSKNSTLSQ